MNLTLLVLGFTFVVFAFAETNSSNSTEPRGNARIVGGQEVTKLIPYQVSVEVPMGDGVWGHICGGSIITSRHVLTAGHCVVTGNKLEDPKNRAVITESFYRGHGTKYMVKNMIHHPKFINDKGKRVNGYDIAIIHVKEAIKMKPHKVAIIELSTEQTGAGVECLATGWGSTISYQAQDSSDVLKELRMKTVSKKECQKVWFNTATDDILCATGGDDAGVCAGDSGGPLVDVKTKKLVGVAQAIYKNCADSTPDLFVRVSTKVDWIRKNTGQDTEGMGIGRPMKPIRPMKPKPIHHEDCDD